jgi:O-antigen/teichoic acid export membrane protein
MSRVTSDPPPGPAATTEADDATRGSAIKLAAEVLSRLMTLGTTVLIARGLGAAGFGAFGRLWILAPVVAEAAEFGLQATATRALVAGTLSWRSLVRARAAVFTVVIGAVLVVALGPLAAFLQERTSGELELGVLAVLVLFFALSGWAEFFGVALRCRGARVAEGLLLLALRAGGLVLAAAALAVGTGFGGLAGALLLSTLPALAFGAWLLRRTPVTVAGVEAPVPGVLTAAFPLAVYGGLLILSSRVELLVLSPLGGDREVGLFLAAVNLVWPLSLVPSAVAAGAMPALTREALAGGSVVRRRTAASLALFAAPAAVGLALVAPALMLRVFGPDYVEGGAASWLRILAVALIPLFMNGLLTWSLIAAGRAGAPPRLLAARILAAFVLASVLVPRLGATGAAIGFVCAELLLLLLGSRAATAAGFPVPVARPVAGGLVATVPMALAVWGVRDSLPLALTVGVLTYVATLAAAWQLLPGPVRRLLGARDDGSESGPASGGDA